MSERIAAAAAGPSVQALSRRVALRVTAIVGLVYVLAAVAVAAIVTNNLTSQVDHRLNEVLARPVAQTQPDHGYAPPPPDRPFGLPTLVWTVYPNGSVFGYGDAGNVELPAGYRQVAGPETVTIGGVQMRIAGRSQGLDYVVAAQTLQNVQQTQGILIPAEIGIGAALLLVVFLGSLAIGRRVAQPIEDARQRQLEFTADASHELRTPLSVIEAQTSLALAKPRNEAWYRSAFERVDAESRRIRRLVDDMLWLARFDATRGVPNAEPVDVTVLAGATVDRFRAIAEARQLVLAVEGEAAIVTVPPEWLDRLLGVLLDNACKYSPEGGSVAVRVGGDAKRVRLAVDDSGPGIPPEERERIFDRFHRATNQPGGAGLGLAIADAIVRATNGRWQVGSSAAGGASLAVTWQRSLGGGRESQRANEARPRAEA